MRVMPQVETGKAAEQIAEGDLQLEVQEIELAGAVNGVAVMLGERLQE